MLPIPRRPLYSTVPSDWVLSEGRNTVSYKLRAVSVHHLKLILRAPKNLMWLDNVGVASWARSP